MGTAPGRLQIPPAFPAAWNTCRETVSLNQSRGAETQARRKSKTNLREPRGSRAVFPGGRATGRTRALPPALRLMNALCPSNLVSRGWASAFPARSLLWAVPRGHPADDTPPRGSLCSRRAAGSLGGPGVGGWEPLGQFLFCHLLPSFSVPPGPAGCMALGFGGTRPLSAWPPALSPDVTMGTALPWG